MVKIQTALLLAAIEADLSPLEARCFFMIDHYMQKSFRFCKQNQSNLASHYLLRAEKLLDKCSENENLKEWCLSVYLPKKAYFLFRAKDFGMATQMIEKCYGVLSRLILEGHDFLLFVLVQQTHNMARMMFFKHEKEKALQLIGDSLHFLTGNKDQKGCLTGKTLDAFINTYPDVAGKIIVSYIDQLLNETLLSLLKNEDQNSVLRLLQLFLVDRQFSLASLPNNRQVESTQKFIEIFYYLALSGDYKAFLHQAHSMRNFESGLSTAQKSVLSSFVYLFSSTSVSGLSFNLYR